MVVATSIFTETQHVFHMGLCGHYRLINKLFGMFDRRSTYEKVTDLSMLLLLEVWGDTIQPTAWRSSMNNESIIWWKLLPSRQKHEILLSNQVKWARIITSSETRVE